MEEEGGSSYSSVEDLEKEGYAIRDAVALLNGKKFVTTFPPTNMKLPKELQDKVCTLKPHLIFLIC